jgi:hypothetical protein
MLVSGQASRQAATTARALILAALGCLLVLQPAHEAEAQNGQSNRTEPRQSAPARSARDLPSPAPYKADCERPKSLEESDLCAQWGAAKAVRDANSIGAEVLYWTRLGFFAILATLTFTALATLAAGRAAKAALRSLNIFQAAEGGVLVPAISLKSPHVVHVGAINHGRTMVSVIHAELACVAEFPKGKLPFAMAGGYESDVGIASGKSYDFKARGIELPNALVYLVGGLLYRNMFGEYHVCKIAVKLNRNTGDRSIVHSADFRAWERVADRLTKGKRLRMKDM